MLHAEVMDRELTFAHKMSLKRFSFFMDLPMAELIKLAEMAGVMYEAGHAYSVRSTW